MDFVAAENDCRLSDASPVLHLPVAHQRRQVIVGHDDTDTGLIPRNDVFWCGPDLRLRHAARLITLKVQSSRLTVVRYP